MFWVVKSTALHILGSIHFLPDPPKFTDAEEAMLHSARVFAFESNFELDQGTPTGYFRGNRTLDQEVPPPLLAATSNLWSQLQLETPLSTVRPWWAAFIVISRLIRREGLSQSSGVDQSVLEIAKRQKGELFFLEPAGTGTAAFASAPANEQLESLTRAVLHSEEGIADVKKMIEAWLTRNPRALESLRQKYLRQMPIAYSAALGGRNRKWLPKLLQLAKGKKPAVAVVGALHMVGPDGIPALLAKAGYECVQVEHLPPSA